jgi:2'-5' RNA ligase
MNTRQDSATAEEGRMSRPLATRTLQDHWRWRPEWGPDRPGLWWYLTFDDKPDVGALGERIGASLTGCTAVDVVPARYLHLTLRELGYLHELTADEIDEAAEATRAQLAEVPAFELELASPDSLHSAVVVKAQPSQSIEQLRACLPGREPRPGTDAYGSSATVLLPHVSVAYVNRDCSEPEVMNRVPHDVPPVRVPIERVALVAVTRRERHYQWIVEHDFALARTTAQRRATSR